MSNEFSSGFVRIVKKIIGIISLLIAIICTLGLMAPTFKMTLEEVIKGKSVFALVGFIFASLAYYLLRYKK